MKSGVDGQFFVRLLALNLQPISTQHA